MLAARLKRAARLWSADRIVAFAVAILAFSVLVLWQSLAALIFLTCYAIVLCLLGRVLLHRAPNPWRFAVICSSVIPWSLVLHGVIAVLMRLPVDESLRSPEAAGVAAPGFFLFVVPFVAGLAALVVVLFEAVDLRPSFGAMFYLLGMALLLAVSLGLDNYGLQM
jgi:hypothetical protein